MKTIFVNRYFYPDHSATSQMLTDLAFGLAEHQHQILVITSRQRYDNASARLPALESIKGVDICRVWTPTFGRGNLIGRAMDYLGFYVTASIALLRHARAGDIVVAKTDPPLISVPAAVVAGIRRARLVNWLQDLFPEVAQQLGVAIMQGGLGRIALGLRNWSLRKAALNVAIGQRMVDRIRAIGIEEHAIALIPNWADAHCIQAVSREDNRLRAEWGISSQFVIGYSGNLGRAHETETLIGAMRILDNKPSIRFLFIGAGHGLEQLRSEVESAGLGNAMFQPYQPRKRLAESLSAADAHLVILRPELEGLIVPSKFYGVLAAGRPVVFVGDQRGEVAQQIARHQLGVTVSAGDSKGLAEAITKLADSGDEDWASRARATMNREYDTRIGVARWERRLSDLAERL